MDAGLDVTAEVEAFTWGQHGQYWRAIDDSVDASFSAKLAARTRAGVCLRAPNASRLEIGGAEST